VKRETSEGLIEKGVCSNYLANLLEGDTLDATVVRSSFRCPSNPNFPIIMIAAGTGIASFMAFIEERAAEFDTYTQYADWHFFYGCRSKSGIKMMSLNRVFLTVERTIYRRNMSRIRLNSMLSPL